MNYKNTYNQIIENCKINPSMNIYTEQHHIIPRCLGGSDLENNLVTVSTKEHYLLHHLLVKIYPENKSISRAFKMLRNRLHIDRNSNPYSCIRKCEYSEINTPRYGKSLSKETKQKMSESLKGERHPMYGKHLSEEHKRKLSENHSHYWKDKPRSEETKRKLSESMKGVRNPMFGKSYKRSEETKRKISESRTGKIWVNNSIIAKQVFPNEIPDGFVKGRLKN